MRTPCAPGLIRKKLKRGKAKDKNGQKNPHTSKKQLLYNGRRKQWADKTERGRAMKRWEEKRKTALR